MYVNKTVKKANIHAFAQLNWKQIQLTDDPKHDISSTKQVQYRYSSYIESDTQLIDTE